MRNIEIYTNRKKALFYVLISLFLVLVDVYMLIFRADYLAEGLFSLLLFGGMLAYSIYLLFEKSPAIVLANAGVTYRGLRGNIIFWERMEYAEVVYVARRRKCVKIHLKTPQSTINPRKMSYRIDTSTTMINPYELCDLVRLLYSVPAEKRQEVIDAITEGVDPALVMSRYSRNFA